MVRARYTARAGAARRRGTLYRGARVVKAAPAVVLVPVEGDLVECPVCRGGVKTVLAPFTDADTGIYHGDRVYGSHKFGGVPGGRQDKCSGSHAALR